ncbi:MAG: N-6 DNA methylase [Candidatus Thermoplasmatota archaeon]|nr:N-6 DNA methylase [Candidatus Thermoplasmatota archaeon]
MHDKRKRSAASRRMEAETKHEIQNKQLAKLLDNLETLYKNVKLGNTTLTMQEESSYVMDYLKALVLSKPESAASEKLLKPIMQVAGIENFPEGRVGGGWVDFILPSSREIGPPVALELKPLHGSDGKLNPLSKEFDQLVDQVTNTRTNQIIRYILGGNGNRGVDFVVFTNLKEVYIFDKGCITKFEPARKETFKEFIEAISVTKNISDYLRRVTEELEKRDLDRYFFNDLKKWFGYLQELDWNSDPQVNSVLLLNKLIFALTLEDFMIIDYRETWDMFSRNFNKWSAKGPKAVLKNFFKELDEFLYEYYDTELFVPSNSILSKFKESNESYAKLLKTLRSVAGFVDEPTLFSGGLYSYNFRLINEDVFGKSYETFLAENRKESGIYYTPNQITGRMASDLVQHLFGKIRDKLVQDLSIEEYDEALILADQLVKITIFDPACGSGAFLVSVLREIVKVYSDIKPKTEWINQLGLKEISEPERVRIDKVRQLRETLGFNGQMKGIDRILLSKIILRHIYGCDLDNTALNVAKVNLWKETVKLNPESFYFQSLPQSINHILPALKVNFVCGNSIVGLSDEYVVKYLTDNFREDIKSMLDLRKEYLKDPSNADIAEKIEEIKEPIRSSLSVEFGKIYPELESPLFYPLEFFFIYFSENGIPVEENSRKFSALIGNPPWNDVKPIKKEFAQKHPSIFGEGLTKFSISGKEFEKTFDRKLMNAETKELWKKYRDEIHALSDFIRKNYGLQYKGDTSLQKTFLEKFIRLSRDAFAILIPSNFHTDEGASDLRKEIFDKWQLNYLISFENKHKVWFNMESRFKFDMLFVTSHKTGESFKAKFYVHNWKETERLLDYPIELILKLSPQMLGVMEFRSEEDVEIIRKIRADHQSAFDYGFRFSREFGYPGDNDLLEDQPSHGDIPAFEGKTIHQYDSNYSDNRYWINEMNGRERLKNSFIQSVTKYFNDKPKVAQMLEKGELLMDYETDRLVLRRQARTTDERTLIASIVPKRNFLLDSLAYQRPYQFEVAEGKIRQVHNMDEDYYLLALLNSFVLDYYIRQRISANLNFSFLYELPIPKISNMLKERVVSLARELVRKPTDRAKRTDIEILIAKEFFKLSKEDITYILNSFVYGDIDKELIELIKEKYEHN